MDSLWSWLLAANYLLAVALILAVIRQRKEPQSTLAWILALITLPFIGIILYWLLGSERIRRRAQRRRRRLSLYADLFRARSRESARRGGNHLSVELSEPQLAIERLGRALVEMPAVGGNAVDVYHEAEATYAALRGAIQSAADHVHLEYYIWQNDATGVEFRDLLIQKARDGVECRVLLDAVGCWKLGRRFLRPMAEAGVKVEFFLPLWPLHKRWSPNLRNHRKIAVIDGRIAFVGSQNIGDEYRGRKRWLSPWIDTHLRISGPAALFVQQVFAEDWFFAAREQLDHERYFPAPSAAGSSIVQMLPTGPDQTVSALEQVLFAAVSSANDLIRIATPYFVPDAAIRMALRHACVRDVRVEVVLPVRTDVPFMLWVARSFYAELLDAGVHIYEFQAGVLHSKIATIDNRWCLVGSANMDTRSFRLNFEATAAIYDDAFTTRLSESIERKLADSRRITAADVWNRRLDQQLLLGAARLLSPML